MDLLQQYLRETHTTPADSERGGLETFKAEPTNPRPIHTLAHHARYRGAGGQPFSAPAQAELQPR